MHENITEIYCFHVVIKDVMFGFGVFVAPWAKTPYKSFIGGQGAVTA